MHALGAVVLALRGRVREMILRPLRVIARSVYTCKMLNASARASPYTASGPLSLSRGALRAMHGGRIGVAQNAPCRPEHVKNGHAAPALAHPQSAQTGFPTSCQVHDVRVYTHTLTALL
jgi:hypothetical protein